MAPAVIGRALAFAKRRKLRLVAAVVALVLAGVVVSAVTSDDGGGDEAQRIVVAPVAHRTLQDVVTVQGEVAHEETGSLNMLSDGRVTSIDVDDGDTVRAGQQVAAFDGRPAIAETGKFPFWRELEEGAIGFDVLQLEQILDSYGFDPGPVDLDFTAQTRKALLSWQAQYEYSVPEPEPDESITFSLSSGNGYDIGALSSAAAVLSEEPGGTPAAADAAPDAAPASLVGGAGRVTSRPALARTWWASAIAAARQATPSISVAASPVTVVEGDVARVIFQSTINAPADVTINYSFRGTARGGSDYDVIDGTAILETGERQVEVLLQTFDDDVLEADETITFEVEAGTGYTIGPDPAITVTIEDETVPEVTVTAAVTEAEEGTVIVFTFRSDQKMLTDTQVDFSLGGDVTEEDDYNEVPNDNVVIRKGRDTAELRITTIRDSVLEGPELLSVEVSNPPDFLEGSYAVGPVAQAEVDVVDDFASLPLLTVNVDALTVAEGEDAVFTIEANVDIAEAVEVHYQLGGSTVEGADYPDADSSVDLSGGDGDDEGFASADVTLTMDEDGVVERDEVVTLTLLPSPTHEYRIGAPGAASITVESADLPELSVRGGGHVFEGGSAGFTITSDQPLAEATSVTYNLGGTASQGDDYKSDEGVIVMPAGATAVTVGLLTIDDDAVFQPGDMIVGEWPTRIGTVEVDLGEFVVEGTKLMSLTEDALTVTVSMSPTDREKLAEGMKATVELTATSATADATISELEDSPTVDENGGQTYDGEVVVVGDLSAVDGAGVNVDVVLKEVPDAITVPVASLVGSGDNVEVRVVNADGSTLRVPVETGLTEGAFVEVTKGLKGDERVIVEVSG